MRMKMDEVKKLLEEIWLQHQSMNKSQERFSAQLAPDFKMLSILGSDELALSKYFALLLNPRGEHGQGSLFLDLFLQQFDIPSWLRKEELVNCKVTLEKQTNAMRRIDIFLQFKSGVIGIENKPWAVEQNNQLNDYKDFLKSSVKQMDNYLLIYICNSSPSSLDSDKQSSNFAQMSFAQILKWLGQCMQYTQALNVRVFIEELQKIIRTEVNGELDMSLESVLVNTILSDKNHLEAMFDVCNVAESIKQKLIKQLEEQLLDEIKSNHPSWILEFYMGDLKKKWSGFNIQFNKSHDFKLVFEFDGVELQKLYWGIGKKEQSTQRNSVIWERIQSHMEVHFGSARTNPNFPWWTSDLSEISDEHEAISNWRHHPLAWQMILNGELCEKIIALAEKVEHTFEFNESLLQME